MEIVLSIIAIVVSGISIIASVVCASIAYFQNKRINNINMKSRFFEKIFDDYLISTIPEARRYLRFSEGHLVDGEKLGDELNALLNRALYFKFDNKSFFDELKHNISKLEDYIMECGNKNFDNEEQAVVFSKIHEQIEEIYSCINDYYIGK